MRSSAKPVFITIFIVALTFLLFQNCSEVDFSAADLRSGELPRPPNAPNDDAVCDPFTMGMSRAENGLSGELRYLVLGVHGDTAAQLNSRHIDYYLSDGIRADGQLFFSNLATPTLSFTAGFQSRNGELLRNPATDEPLVEYFSLSFDTRLRLGPNDSPGLYQLALLSDDGSILDVEVGAGIVRLIDNDGTHSTRLVCATQALELGEDTQIPAKIHYFQGPRTEIALQLLWRQVNSADDLDDLMCGRTGSNVFFTGFANGGTPQPTSAYQEMLSISRIMHLF